MIYFVAWTRQKVPRKTMLELPAFIAQSIVSLTIDCLFWIRINLLLDNSLINDGKT